MNLVRRVWAHMRALWPRWTLLPPAPFVLWSLGLLLAGSRRWELILLLVVVPALAYGTERTRKLLIGLYPLGLVGLLYDAMRFVKQLGLHGPGDVHACDLSALDARLFGVSIDGQRLGLPDLMQRYPSTLLDVVCAIPYGTFIYAIIGYAIWLYFHDFAGMRRFVWTYFALNVIGFCTYHLYPAAPPWYVHAHGCAVDLGARASAGPHLEHVDAMLGVPYFASFYGRSNDVFGAVPSLHAGYPLLIVLEGWPRHALPGRVVMVAFMVSMWFAAVYLDHHWPLDVILGIFYALAAYALVHRLFQVAAKQAKQAVPTPARLVDHEARAPEGRAGQEEAP